jgi:hypothetical protein
MNYWKVFCMEKEYPGLWQRCFKLQCVAIGFSPKNGNKLHGESKDNRRWSATRNALKQIQAGDWIMVQLKNHRVGRVGQVVNKEIEDGQWKPLVPGTKTEPNGHMGRRINVRWSLNVGPFDPEMVVKLPDTKRLSSGSARPTIAKIDRTTFDSVVGAMKDETNWRHLLSKFTYERSLSDYIATYPHRVEDGLQPFPSEKVREKVFKDKSRSDVLLIDRKEIPVVVECKQDTPTVKNVHQLRGYMKNLRAVTGKKPRGILIHGGARKLRKEVRRAANHKPRIEVVQYSLNVEFARCR